MKQQLIQAAATALLMGAMPAAQALPTLRLQVDSGPVFECVDGAACDTMYAVPGLVSISEVLNGTFVTVTNGASKPLLAGGNPLVDLGTFNVQVSGGAHTLSIMFSDNGFNLYGGRFAMEFGGVLSGEGSSVQHAAYYDTGNNLFAQSELIGQVSAGTGPFSGAVAGGWSPDAPYSVTEILTLRTGGFLTTLSGDFEVNVPEPTTLALFGVGLIGLAAVRRRRQSS